MSQYDHPWDVTPLEARAIQDRLGHAVILEDQLVPVRFVAGIDLGYEKANSVVRAAAVVLRFPGLELVGHSIVHESAKFPYIPGLLSFREGPATLEALEQLKVKPDLLICDGHGYAHPKRFGLACHIGLLSGIPAIGAAKTRLIGRYDSLAPDRGAIQPLWDGEEMIGMVVRTRDNVKPLFISAGHKVSLETAVHYVLACTPRYRLPETARWAHRLASG